MPAVSKRKGFFNRLKALIRLKLVVPLLRSRKPPEFTAKGAAVGMGWAMTPLVGVQMYLVFMTWLGTRRFLKWDFSLPVALAFTWVTNVLTVPPFYYAFYITGKAMTGTLAERTTYAKFTGMLKDAMTEGGIVEALKTSLEIMIKDWGVSMMIGSVPWIVVGSWLAYRYVLAFSRKREQARQKRLEKKAQAEQKAIRDSERDMV